MNSCAAGAKFEKGSWSNDPTNQEVTLTPRDTPIHRPFDYCSQLLRAA